MYKSTGLPLTILFHFQHNRVAEETVLSKISVLLFSNHIEYRSPKKKVLEPSDSSLTSIISINIWSRMIL